MKLSSLIALRPISFFMLLVFLVLLLPSLIIPCWFKMTKRIEHDVDMNHQNFVSGLLSQVERTAKLLHPLNSSATHLARVLSSHVNASELSFSEIESKVAPTLFHALSLTPHASQISYVGVRGLFFSYYVNGNQTLALYSNASSASYNTSTASNETITFWYTQPVNHDSGMLYGEAVKSSPMNAVDTRWFHEALNNTNGYASVENALNSAHDLVFQNAASVSGKGVVALGFPVKELIDFFTGIDFHEGRFHLATNDGQVLVGGIPNTRLVVPNKTIALQLLKQSGAGYHQTGAVKTVVCMHNNGDAKLRDSVLDIGGNGHVVFCSSLDIVGVQSVYALTLPHKGSSNLVHETSRLALILLIVMIVLMMISILSFLFLMIRGAKMEMDLRASLIKQMEATQQAERKSMNKSLAFARASHDIRGALAAITASIELCEAVAPQPELKENLEHMKRSTNNLVGLLNSILDTSKIEYGKMQLDEEEFNIAQLVEDVVDLHHPGGMKKGVDVVLDTHDGSILKFSDVKGDRGRLNQILNNLLSNAVKFTSEGHVTVRAWARKHKVNQLMLDSNHDGFLKYLSCLLFHKNNEETRKDLEATNGEGQNTNLIEFIFEVDDTGVGIPKEKRESVFENFVQVKETALGKGGTGLGLGIVQSLVRLMGGEIGIVDKEIGKKGTCFRFNVYLTASGTSSTDIFDSGEESRSGLLTNLAICSPTEGLSMRTPSPRLNFLGRKPSLKLEGSHVVLLMGDEERRRVSHKFMESLGINVYVVNQWEQLASTLNKLKSKWNTSHSSIGSSGKLEISQPLSDASSGRLKDVPLSSMDGTDQKPPLYRRKGSPGFVLMVIDATVGPFSELLSVVADFKSGLQSTCYKAVWLNKPISCRIERENLDPSDDVLLKPLHGSRLYEVIKLLPEFGVASASPQGTLNKPEKESTVQRNFLKDFSSSSAKQTYVSPKSGNPPPRRQSRHHGEIEENDSSDDEKSGKKVLPFSPIQTRGGRFEVGPSLQQTEIQEEFTNLPIDNKPLSGKRILVVEDDRVIRILAGKKISQLGATVELCEDGEKAKKLVCNGLRDQTNNGAPHILPYDYILMDCEMEPMTGSEATRSIRAEEKHYGVHIPIIAFTSHESEEARKTIDSAGMDAYLSKPLDIENLIETIRKVNRKLQAF